MASLLGIFVFFSAQIGATSQEFRCPPYAIAHELAAKHPQSWVVWVFPEARAGRLALKEMGLVSGPLVHDSPLGILKPAFEKPPSVRSSVWETGQEGQVWIWCSYDGMYVFQAVPARASVCYSKRNKGAGTNPIIWCDKDGA